MNPPPLSVEDLHPELRSRVLAAGGNAEHRAIERLEREGAPEQYAVLSLSGEQLALMELSLRPDGSVQEHTETFLVGDTRLLPDTDTPTIEVESAGTVRRLALPPSLGEALSRWLRPE